MGVAASASAAVDRATEQALVQGWQAGREEAAARLYAVFVPRLVARLRRRGCDHHIAEDLAHDAWIKASHAIDRFDPCRPLWPWLATIADRTLADHRRRTKTKAVDDSVALESAPAVVYTEPDHAPRLTTRLVLGSAVGALTPVLQQAFVAVQVVGLSHGEAADRLGLGEAAVRQRSHRARQRLRETLVTEQLGGLAPLVWLRYLLWQARDRSTASSALPGLSACAATAVQLGLVAVLVATPSASAAPKVVDFEPAPPEVPTHTVEAVDRHRGATRPDRFPVDSHDAGSPVVNSTIGELGVESAPAEPAQGSVVEVDPIPVPATGRTVATHRDPDRDYREYGARVTPPIADPVSAHVGAHDEEPGAEVHAEACETAKAGDPFTYCDS